jgi:hypothetical protein
MPKQPRPRVTKDQASTEASGSPDTDSDPPDLAKVMAAIIKSEQTELAKVESLSTDLSAQIAILATEVNTKMDSVKDDLAKHDTCLNSLEGGANTYFDKVVTLEEQITRTGCLKQSLGGPTHSVAYLLTVHLVLINFQKMIYSPSLLP